jgi:hypothetical protein
MSKIGKGRIFLGDNILQDDGSTLDMNVEWMQPETIYYADEGRNGVTSHPLGGILFLTTENELAVIDITA